MNQDRSVDEMQAGESVLERTGLAMPQLKHLWRGAAGCSDNFGKLPQNAPTTMVFDKQVALFKAVRGRVPAELWDDIAERDFTRLG